MLSFKHCSLLGSYLIPNDRCLILKSSKLFSEKSKHKYDNFSGSYFTKSSKYYKLSLLDPKLFLERCSSKLFKLLGKYFIF